MNKKNAIIHGECIIFESEIPADAVLEKIDTNFTIIANSETTGNHHVIDMNPGVAFFKKDNRRFMRNEQPTSVRCVIADRHDTVVIKPGNYEIGIQQEFDYFAMAKRNVQD